MAVARVRSGRSYHDVVKPAFTDKGNSAEYTSMNAHKHTTEVPMWSDADLYWLAGLLEGEGSFLAGPPSRPNSPRVSLTMIDYDVVRRAADLLGVKSFRTVKRNERWQTAYSLTLRGSGAIAAMREMYPLMGVRRQAQINRALDSYDPNYRKRRQSPLSEQQVLEIYRRAHSGESLHQISWDMGVSYNACSDIKCGQSWGWLTGHVRDDLKSGEGKP